jgi:serine/threonine protein phosphatase PrpC
MFVKNTLPDWLQRRRDAFHADRKNTLVTLFRNLNDALCEDSRIDTYMSGTTAAVVFVWTSSRRLTIAHVGDSRVVAGRRNPDGTLRAEQITK